MQQSHSNDQKNSEQDNRLTKLETLIPIISTDIADIKVSINNHIGTLTKRIAVLEAEMSKRWSRPEAITLGIMMSIITGLVMFLITR